ncbi:MAG TPA: helicase-related protein, partial [Cyclobacteriaceae bacterium]|nr:helicase-related protein [Cyclobacteriaceae bacterium]
MVAAAMEMKRMGIAKKVMIIGLKANAHEIAHQFRTSYPNAKVLTIKENGMSATMRKKTLAQIANNDWDAVVITHDNYKAIPHDPEISGQAIREELEMLEEDIAALEEKQGRGASKMQMSGLQKRKENLLAKLDKLSDVKKDKEMRTFQELGIDHLMVDESQEFKNLTFSTRLGQVAGLGDPTGSQKALNLLFGVRSLQQLHRGDKGVTFLSGTPISNTMVEMYLLMKYLRPRALEEKGMKTFDAWVTSFASKSNDVEFSVIGALANKTRFREFLNVPELAMMYNEIADVRNDSNLLLPKPEFEKSINLSFDEDNIPAEIPAENSVYKLGDGELRFYTSSRLGEAYVDVRGLWVKKPTTDISGAQTIEKISGDGPARLDIKGFSTSNYILKNIKQTPVQQHYNKLLQDFVASKGLMYREELGLKPWDEKQKKSVMVNATTVSSKNAIDPRLINPHEPEEPGGKLDVAADTIYNHWEESTPYKGTQLVFSDIGTPKGKETVPNLHQLLQEEYGVNDDDLKLIFGEANEDTGKYSVPLKTVKERLQSILDYTPMRIDELIEEANDTERKFNLYGEIKRKLVERGIPEHEVAFIHDYGTKTKREDLFKKVNAGDIRVLLGSTKKLGTGVNVQERLRSMHHIDVLWRPADMEQRNGRGVRQRNFLARDVYDNQVPVYAYATELTLDAMKYQLLAIKQAYIDQIKSGAIGERTFDEGDAD